MTDQLNTPADYIQLAKDHLADGGQPAEAIAHALIALAELAATNMTNVVMDATTRGALAVMEALGTVLDVINPGGPITSENEPCYVCQSAENVIAGWYCTHCSSSGRR